MRETQRGGAIKGDNGSVILKECDESMIGAKAPVRYVYRPESELSWWWNGDVKEGMVFGKGDRMESTLDSGIWSRNLGSVVEFEDFAS